MAPKIAIVFVGTPNSERPFGASERIKETKANAPRARSIRRTDTYSGWRRRKREGLSRLEDRLIFTSKFRQSSYASGCKAPDYGVARIAETLPQEILDSIHAPPKSSHPIIGPEKLTEYDAVLFGIPTRYGNFPVQWKAFWDSTGEIWQTGRYWGKYAGLFVSTGTPGGGQESTAIAAMSTLSHHGFLYVPLGYKPVFSLLTDLSEIHGGSPWGAGTFAVSSFRDISGS